MQVYTIAAALFALLMAAPAHAQSCDPAFGSSTCAACLTCSTAPGGHCAYYHDACVSEPDCAFYAAACEYMLPADPQGYAACLDAHPVGAALYAALIDCMVCVQCPGCDPWGWVDPHPGCGEEAVCQ